MGVFICLTLDSQHRARFQPNMFHHETPSDATKNKGDPKLANSMNAITSPPNPEPGDKPSSRRRPGFGTRWSIAVQRLSSREQHSHRVPSDPKTLTSEGKASSATSSTVLGRSEHIPATQEVWFAGCHSDVGGGAVEDAVRYSLGDISLRWMVKQVIISQCGIRFDATALRRADIDVSNIVVDGHTQTIAEKIWRKEPEPAHGVSPTPPTSHGEGGSGEDMIQKGEGKNVEAQPWPQDQDVLTDIHDQLKIQRSWWLLETMPMKYVWQEPDGTWKSKWGYALASVAFNPTKFH